MKRFELIICSALFASILWIAPAFAFDMPARGKWWHNQHMITTLSLSEEQSKNIDKIFLRHRKEFLELSVLLRKRYRALETYLETQSREDLDHRKLNEMVEAVQKTRTRLEKSRLLMLLEVRRVLSRQQAEMLRQIRRDMIRHMEQMGEDRGGHMGGRGIRGR